MSWKNLVEQNEKIDLEKLNSFLNMAVTSTIQDEYYSDADEQSEAVFKAHKDMLENQREVYSLSVLLPINDVHKQYMVFNLLKNSKDLSGDQKRYENNIILTALKHMPTNRAYKIFTVLRRNKVNNARTRWVAQKFLESRSNLVFESVKYKKWIKDIIVHNHLKPSNDTGVAFDFLFNKIKANKKYPELITNYLNAKKDVEAVYKLPYSVAVGFKNLHKIKDDEFYEKIKAKMTHSEKLRAQNVSGKADVKIGTDLSSYSPVRLLKYLRASETAVPKAKAFNSFETGCKKIANGIPLSFKSIQIVVDRSASMYGSAKKKSHPVSVAEACAGVLMHLTSDGSHIKDELKKHFLENPMGSTDLSAPILAALKKEPELLVIISDGYENQPAGLANQVINAYLSKIGKAGIIHLNPVFAPESNDVRKLNDKIITMGIRDVNQLLLILLIALTEMKKASEVMKILAKLKKKVVVA